MRRMGLIISSFMGILLGILVAIAVILQNGKKESKWETMSKKHLALMLLLNQWLKSKQEGKTIIDYFHRNKIKSIAIYGMSYIGERLYEELKKSDVEVRYAIDKQAEAIYTEIDVVTPESEMLQVDAIIVTAVYFYEEIKEMLGKKVETRIISLEDILYEL